MKLPRLLDDDPLRRVALEALVAQVMAGGLLADWQIDRLLPIGCVDPLAAARRLELMVHAEAARRRRDRAKAPPTVDRRRTPLKRSPSRLSAQIGPRF